MLDLNIETTDSMALGQNVELDGHWKGTIERDPERYGGIGTVLLRIEPTYDYDATMQIGPTVLYAHHRALTSDLVWREDE
jgi:hypothetical protein